jgi:hypothetical protein
VNAEYIDIIAISSSSAQISKSSTCKLCPHQWRIMPLAEPRAWLYECHSHTGADAVYTGTTCAHEPERHGERCGTTAVQSPRRAVLVATEQILQRAHVMGRVDRLLHEASSLRTSALCSACVDARRQRGPRYKSMQWVDSSTVLLPSLCEHDFSPEGRI